MVSLPVVAFGQLPLSLSHTLILQHYLYLYLALTLSLSISQWRVFIFVLLLLVVFLSFDKLETCGDCVGVFVCVCVACVCGLLFI